MNTDNLLDTSNRHRFIYTSENIMIEILGGIRVDVMDGLRVTIKIAKGEQSIRHNLDLYNDAQVDKLIRKTAEKLEIGSILAGKLIAELTDQLEKYRLKELGNLVEKESPVVLSEQERQAVIDFLQSPDLLDLTNAYIGRSGVIGEQNNRLLMYLIFTSRKREQPLQVISLGSTGTGKSHLQEKIEELMPDPTRQAFLKIPNYDFIS